ncbi:hypothetical protein [Aneurinibacillus soli]|uniref:hypothetical protein n=1 Tax=Aneurinibacillus soli TaxID=1500254 RepID=UPI0011B7A5BA|nr:hypothetical protein [Aneurinibacillus soli]
MVKERDQAEPRHFGTLATEWELSAPGARRTRPQRCPRCICIEALWAKARSPDPFRWVIAYRRSVAPPDPAPGTI